VKTYIPTIIVGIAGVKLSQTEFRTAKLPASVWVAKPRHIDGAEDVSSVSEEIGSGRAFLKVVAYPWGVEFDVCSKEGTA
jgi:hypothetical protein